MKRARRPSARAVLLMLVVGLSILLVSSLFGATGNRGALLVGGSSMGGADSPASPAMPGAGGGHAVRSIPVGVQPFYPIYNPLTRDMYVTNNGSRNVSIIDSSTNRVVGSIPAGVSPAFVAYDPSAGLLYVANYGLQCNASSWGSLTVVNASTNAVVTELTAGHNPAYVLYDPANGDLYVADFCSTQVSVVDGRTSHLIGQVAVGLNPVALAYDPSNQYVYSMNVNFPGSRGSVSVINGTTQAVVETIEVGDHPESMTFDPVNEHLYVGNLDSDSVTVIDCATNQVVATVAVGSQPVWVTYSPANHDLYVENFGSTNVTVIDGATDRVVATVPAGVQPGYAVYVPSSGDIYVANSDSQSHQRSTVTDIAADNTVVATIPVGIDPNIMAYDPANGLVYVPNYNSQDVTVISTLTVLSVGARPNPVAEGNLTTISTVVTGGMPPYTYGYAGLPAGCTSSNTSTLACVPSASGAFSITVRVADSGNDSVASTLTLEVQGPAPSPGFLGLPGIVGYAVLGALVAMAVGVVSVLVYRGRRRGGARP